ncbi:MOSC domain-containing protein [Pasteurella sp. P03HT]
MQLQQLYLYPIKSTQAYGVSQAVVQPQGLHFDREFMLTEQDGTFITARKDHALYHLTALPLPQGLFVQHKLGEKLIVHYRDFTQQISCEVWGSHFLSWVANDNINQWFSHKLGRAVQLRWLGEHVQRRIKKFPDIPVSFADGYPILLTTSRSLDALQAHCPRPIDMRQFRPNFVIDGESPFVEQQWKKIQIGELTFLNAKPCERCVLTTRHLEHNIMDPHMEPFRTLKKINRSAEGQPLFGINLIPLKTGIIRCGDPVQVLE